MLFEDRSRAESFGALAELYDRSRPSYPSALIDYLVRERPRRVLDVGCGTGIAGAPLAKRGCAVLGVETDARMAAVARRKGFEVEVAPYERWEDGGRRFELLTCGQAWHWIEPQAGAAKAATVLAPGGRIGLFWNFATLPEGLRTEMTAIYARLAPGFDARSTALGRYDDRGASAIAALDSVAAFNAVEKREFSWARTYTTEEWLAQLPTHSDHQQLPAAQLGNLLDAVREAIDGRGGAFEMSYDVMLITALRQ